MPRTYGTTTQRGYGAAHQAERARWAPIVARGGVICWRCGEPIRPGQPWDLGHDDNDRTIYRGPEHRGHNRAAGARKGNKLRGLRRRRVKAMNLNTSRTW